MRKLSVLALVLALMLIFTACASPSGLLLKEATLKQMELESFESMTTFSFDMNTFLMSNSFNLEIYAKQIDLLNSLSKFYVQPEWLALAGLQVNPSSGKVAFDVIMKDGELIIGTSEDHVGIHFSNFLAMPEGEELPFETKEELEAWLATIQEKVREVFKAYLAEYAFSLDHIHDLGQTSISLPNGETVETTHIQLELSLFDLLNLIHYSLEHVVADEEFQTAFYNMLVELTLLEEGRVASELADAEVAELKATLQEEINPLVQDLADGLKEFIEKELSNYEDVMLGAFSSVIDTYIGVDDQEVYQQDYRLDFTYTAALNELELEGKENLPFLPGDSISISLSQQIWNHNEQLDPIAVPEQLITVEELEALESMEEFRQIAGEDSLLAQIAEQVMGFMGDISADFGFVELKPDEQKLETMAGSEDAQLYLKDGQLMAPLAQVSRAMGADVAWDEASRQITVNTGEHTLQVDVAGERIVSVDGLANADIIVEIVDGTSYVNVRAFAEALDWTVLWIEDTRSALMMK